MKDRSRGRAGERGRGLNEKVMVTVWMVKAKESSGSQQSRGGPRNVALINFTFHGPYPV